MAEPRCPGRLLARGKLFRGRPPNGRALAAMSGRGGSRTSTSTVSRALTAASPAHLRITKLTAPGTLSLRTQLDLWQMLRPAVQKRSAARLRIPAGVGDSDPRVVHLTLRSASRGKTSRLIARAREPRCFANTRTQRRGSGSQSRSDSHTRGVRTPRSRPIGRPARTRRHRAFPTRRLLMPWARPAASTGLYIPSRPEIRGGDWARGKRLYFGDKALCSTCHQRDGAGTHIGQTSPRCHIATTLRCSTTSATRRRRSTRTTRPKRSSSTMAGS